MRNMPLLKKESSLRTYHDQLGLLAGTCQYMLMDNDKVTAPMTACPVAWAKMPTCTMMPSSRGTSPILSRDPSF